MAPRIHLIRHAEATHNVTKDFSILDPGLTDLGVLQSKKAGPEYDFVKEGRKIKLIITSPLKRALETALYAFSDIIEPHNLKFPASSPYSDLAGKGQANGTPLLISPYLQERSSLPCDTGSPLSVLVQDFPGVDFSPLEGLGWLSGTGEWASDDEAVEKRAQKVRRELKRLLKDGDGEGDIIVVTHGVFMKFLSGDQGIDLAKAGGGSFVFEEGDGDVLVAV